YDTLPHPNVLYNIARAYAEAGQYESSIEYFRRYLDSDPPDREEVLGFIRALEERIAAVRQRETVPSGAEPQVEPTGAEPGAVMPVVSAEEVLALEDSATQIAALAEATQSDALRQRAERLRALAASLRERSGAPTPGEPTRRAVPRQPAAAAPEVPVGVTLGRTGDLDIYEEQVVSASRFAQSPLDAPNATANITRQDIRLSGLRRIGELVRRVPGADVMATTAADTQVSVRGFNQRLSNKMLVLVDGRSVYVDTLGTTFYSTIPYAPEDIERIEVIRGPASALYGADAFSGIINILTRPPGERELSASAGLGTHGESYGHFVTGGRVGRLGYRLAAGFERTPRYSLELDERRLDAVLWDAVPPGQLALREVHVNGALAYRISREARLRFDAGISDNFQNFQATGPVRDFGSYGPASHVMGLLETSWGQVRAFWNRIDATSGLVHFPYGRNAQENRFLSNTVDVEAELGREFRLLVDHNLHVGLGYRLKTIDWDYLDAPHVEHHHALFFQDTMRIVRQLTLVGSFRVDVHPLLDNPVFSPRGALIVRPTEGQAIRASVGTAFRTPTFLESYLSLPNPTPVAGVHVDARGSEVAGIDLRPESILSVETGYRFAESDAFDLEASVYYNRVRDLIILSDVTPYRLSEHVARPADGYLDATASYPIGSIGFRNDTPVYDVIGVEVGGRFYPVRGLDVYANYAFNRAFSSESDRPEERTSAHKVNAGVQYRTSFGADVAVDVHWVSDQVWREQVFDVAQGVRFGRFPLPSYHLVNARLGWRLLDDRLELAISGYNVTGHRHRQHPFAQRIPMRWMGSATYRF
ncbi:MAG: TonB-dependent receptor, partial [Myxococcales bacterium]|nr:TonB-dependent receptor [Myxococcales bacterium]